MNDPSNLFKALGFIVSSLYFLKNTQVITNTQMLISTVKSYNIDIDII